MTEYDYRNNKRDIWISAIGIAIMAVIIIGIAVFGYMRSNASKTNHPLHHLEVANHIPTINKAYAHRDGIKNITFNAKKNHLTIYMTSQKHKPTHYYKDSPAAPITAQAEHAIHVGNMIGNSYNDHHIKTYFKD